MSVLECPIGLERQPFHGICQQLECGGLRRERSSERSRAHAAVVSAEPDEFCSANGSSAAAITAPLANEGGESQRGSGSLANNILKNGSIPLQKDIRVFAFHGRTGRLSLWDCVPGSDRSDHIFNPASFQM